MKKMFYAPFSFHGRIRRLEYIISYVLYYVGIFFAFWLSGLVGQSAGKTPAIIVMCLLLFVIWWFMIAQSTKRCHDMGKSGWWQIIPIFNPFFLAFSDGEEYPNDYGPDPKGRNLYE